MGPSGGPGAACPDLTIALMTPPVSNFFTALAALDILDILSMCLACHTSVRPLCLLGKECTVALSRDPVCEDSREAKCYETSGPSKIRDKSTDVSKSMSARQKLEAQLTENNIVKEELALLDCQNTVYKLIGPVLVKQDLDEAKVTVGKRLEYINGEIQRYETLLKEMEKKSEQHREVLSSLQQEFQRAQGQAVGKV
ncbi:Prefoldin subunit 6 [Anabarilius grahami]|uniref:Prefoldin subunit 6 n=1 Tax=Anabarilius grahami TaxID=495550 RepID=A0A3N0XS44_ANAGA|nr:Prefoldin subunit 6 [Anabarilius grahami]